jgi:hypothetical protein
VLKLYCCVTGCCLGGSSVKSVMMCIVDGATVSTREFPRWQAKPMRLAAVVGRLALQGNVHVTRLLTQPCAAVPQTAGLMQCMLLQAILSVPAHAQERRCWSNTAHPGIPMYSHSHYRECSHEVTCRGQLWLQQCRYYANSCCEHSGRSNPLKHCSFPNPPPTHSQGIPNPRDL